MFSRLFTENLYKCIFCAQLIEVQILCSREWEVVWAVQSRLKEGSKKENEVQKGGVIRSTSHIKWVLSERNLEQVELEPVTAITSVWVERCEKGNGEGDGTFTK